MITTIYLIALAASVGAALVVRWATVRLPRARSHELSPGEIGYLAGGPERAVLAELGRQRDRRPDSPFRPLDRLGAAIYVASAPVERDSGVRTALAGIRRDLGRSGLLLGVAARRAVRGSAILVLGIAAFGLTRYVVGAATGHAVGYLPATLAGAVVGVALLVQAPFRTRAGDLVVRGLSARYPAGPAAADPNAHPQTGYRDIGGGYGP